MDEGFTRVVPPSDGATDDLVGIIQDMINTAVERLYPRLATVVQANPGQGTIRVQFHDEDFEGHQTKAMTAGVAYEVGDTVLCQPVGPTEWVVTQKFIARPQDRRAVGDQEIRNNAVRGNHIQNGSITPNHLDREYTPANQFTSTVNSLNNAISNRVTTAQLNQAIETRQPRGNYPTMGDLNNALRSKADIGHRHDASEVQLMNASGMTTPMLRMRAMIRCHYQNRNKSGNPCAAHLQRLNSAF